MRYAASESLAGAADAIRSIEASRIHHAALRRGSDIAVRGGRAAADDDPHWRRHNTTEDGTALCRI